MDCEVAALLAMTGFGHGLLRRCAPRNYWGAAVYVELSVLGKYSLCYIYYSADTYLHCACIMVEVINCNQNYSGVC